MLNEIRDAIHANAVAEGFWNEPNTNITEKIMLVVTELSEAVEAMRKSNKEDLEKNIIYHNGGYGYYHPITHAWMAYDIMSDMVMMNMLMGNHGYYVGGAPTVVTPVYNPTGTVFLIIAGIIGTVLVVALFATLACKDI